MTPKENLLAAFAHRDVQWAPWLPLLSGVNTPSFVPEDIKHSGDAIAVGRYLQDELGCDILVQAPATVSHQEGVETSQVTEGDSTVYETRIGGRTLRKVATQFPYGDQVTNHIAKYPVETPDDVETLRRLVTARHWEADTTVFEAQTAQMGDSGVVAATGPGTPLMDLVVHEMSLEKVVLALMDMPQIMDNLLEAMHANNIERYRALAQTSCEVIRCTTDESALLISPAMFEKYCMPCLRDYAAICHDAGKRLMVHSCGHIRDFLDMYKQAGIDALHYVTAPPIGNTPVEVAREAWGEEITTMAALDPIRLETAPADEIEREAREKLRQAGSTRSFILMSSSKPAVPEANLRAVAAVMTEQPSHPKNTPSLRAQ